MDNFLRHLSSVAHHVLVCREVFGYDPPMMRILALVFCLTAAACSTLEPAGPPQTAPLYLDVAIPFGKTPGEVTRHLAEKGWDVAGVDLEKRVVVVVGDVAANQIDGLQVLAARGAYPVIDSGYRTHDEVLAWSRAFTEKWPRYVKKVRIGRTAEGRPIEALRLRAPDAPKPGAGEKRRAVLFDALHHAREIATPEVPIDIAEQLVGGAQVETSEERRWLRAMDVWIIPMVNPDGSARVWAGQTMQRKNGRQVDPNRNYDDQRGTVWRACNGSSGSPSNEQYRGPGPLSEKETQAFVLLGDCIRPVAGITYHSFSEMVLYPPGCPGQPRDPKVVALGKKIGAALVRDSGRGTYAVGTSYDLLYPTDGDTTAALWARYGTFSYTVEISSSGVGFHPPHGGYRDDLLRRQRPGWQILLREALTMTPR